MHPSICSLFVLHEKGAFDEADFKPVRHFPLSLRNHSRIRPMRFQVEKTSQTIA